MILENSDKLKDWLSVVLEPLCDADSSALARYVIALLKKDKSDKDLKRIMIEQLDVFLSEETTRFVDRLFDAIASEEYLTMPAPIPAPTAEGFAELELDHDLDGVADIEAVLAANSSVPPPPPPQPLPKDIVIKPDGNQQQISSEICNSREPATEANSASGSSSAAIATDANTIGIQSTKPAVDHKTKDSSHGGNQQQQLTHHHPSSSCGGTVGIGSVGLVRSASPPVRSTGPVGSGGVYAADKENQPRESRRRRASLRSRSRSRSRSNERSFRRSRSRDRRINEREKSQRQFRNKSPPGGASEPRHRRNNNNSNNNFDRRRIGNSNNSNNNNNNNNNNNSLDERNHRFGSNKARHSPRSRSVSPESRNARRSNNIEPAACSSASVIAAAPVPAPVAHLMAAMARQRCRDFDEKGYCVRGETCRWDHGINPVVFEGINNSALMMSMREYNPDAPEIWAHGGPPGVPGVPTGGSVNQQPLPVPPQGGPNSINPFSGNVRACGPVGVPNPADYARQPGQGPGPQGPAPPSMMPFPFNPTAVTTPLQRQLIPIPVMDGGAGGAGGVGGGGGGLASDMSKRRFELEDSVAIADVPSKMRKVPINSRLGPRVNPNMQQHNSSLELRKVPRGLNTIAHLNNHFAKFGKIVNIQVSYEGDPEAAIVTFSTHAEANVAYRSTEAVLNNRFIKVFWHNDNNSNSNSNNNSIDAGNVNINRKSQYHLHNVPAVPTPNADSAKISNSSSGNTNANQLTPLGETGSSNNALSTTATDQALASTAAPASMRLKLNTNAHPNAAANGVVRILTPAANAASIRKKQEEQQKAMHQLANGLRKRKQELLQSYVKQMKTALELVQRMDQQDAQRAPTLQTIKVLQATIDKLRKDVHADQDQLQAQIQQQQQQQQQAMPLKKTKEQQKKELLDIELELIAQQQEGNDTSAIQKRLEELQRTLAATGGVGGGNNMSGGGTKPPGGGARKRGTFPEGSTRVDRRPKAIVVTGFAADEADFVLGHFKHFGEISKHDVDREIPQLILSYATRINAEQAVIRGKMYKDKRLQISWAPVVTTHAAVPMGAPADKLVAALSAPAGDKMDNPKQLLHSSISESDSLLGSDTLPELRLEDEEEDEESEDRSWRR